MLLIIFLWIDYRLMNEFIEAVGEFKMKTQRICNLSPVSIICTSVIFEIIFIRFQ